MATQWRPLKKGWMCELCGTKVDLEYEDDSGCYGYCSCCGEEIRQPIWVFDWQRIAEEVTRLPLFSRTRPEAPSFSHINQGMQWRLASQWVTSTTSSTTYGPDTV